MRARGTNISGRNQHPVARNLFGTTVVLLVIVNYSIVMEGTNSELVMDWFVGMVHYRDCQRC